MWFWKKKETDESVEAPDYSDFIKDIEVPAFDFQTHDMTGEIKQTLQRIKEEASDFDSIPHIKKIISTKATILPPLNLLLDTDKIYAAGDSQRKKIEKIEKKLVALHV